ncbi:MAG TPA: hypothetical protein VLV50_05475 [Stellaceae bacterium]|nr:hypothetical protein [Stellaceae bacterium]
MKAYLLVTVAAVAIAAGAMVALPPVSSAQAPAKSPGAIISVSGSAIVSTQGMPPGSEIWAEWYSLPPGQAVTESASAVKWAYVEMALDGSAVVTGGPTPMCSAFSAGGRQAAGSERVTDPGDVEVCNYSLLPGSRTENRGTQPYVFAGLSVGGPWQEGMEDSGDLYLKVNGLAKSVQVNSAQFGGVEKEILKAGAMTVVIRNVTIPPGARIVTTDHYPTLRMVENGQLILSSTPEGSAAADPKVLSAFDTMEWAPATAEKPITLSNGGDQPVQFVEWTVAPVQGAKP